jgi:hypothetical protein
MHIIIKNLNVSTQNELRKARLFSWLLYLIVRLVGKEGTITWENGVYKNVCFNRKYSFDQMILKSE